MGIKTYDTVPDYPWNDRNVVLRHKENNKWYSVILEIPESKLNVGSEQIVDVLNVKCNPVLVGSLRLKKGIFRRII